MTVLQVPATLQVTVALVGMTTVQVLASLAQAGLALVHRARVLGIAAQALAVIQVAHQVGIKI